MLPYGRFTCTQNTNPTYLWLLGVVGLRSMCFVWQRNKYDQLYIENIYNIYSYEFTSDSAVVKLHDGSLLIIESSRTSDLYYEKQSIGYDHTRSTKSPSPLSHLLSQAYVVGGNSNPESPHWSHDYDLCHG